MLISPSTSSLFASQTPLLPFLNIIPKTLDSSQKVSSEDFIRRRKLPFPKVIISTLSLVANGNHNGVDHHIGTFFRNARRCGLWPEAETIHRSTLTKARKKVPWEVFQAILNDTVQVAYDLWPEQPRYTWHDMSVFATDGSKYTLPATDTIR